MVGLGISEINKRIMNDCEKHELSLKNQGPRIRLTEEERIKIKDFARPYVVKRKEYVQIIDEMYEDAGIQDVVASVSESSIIRLIRECERSIRFDYDSVSTNKTGNKGSETSNMLQVKKFMCLIDSGYSVQSIARMNKMKKEVVQSIIDKYKEENND